MQLFEQIPQLLEDVEIPEYCQVRMVAAVLMIRNGSILIQVTFHCVDQLNPLFCSVLSQSVLDACTEA